MVSFGQEALVEDPPEHQLQFQGFATSPGANFTDIESALRLAGSMAQPGTRRHVVLYDRRASERWRRRGRGESAAL